MAFKPLPDNLRIELEQRIKELYPEAIKNLPSDTSPSISEDFEKGTWKATVTFYYPKNLCRAHFEFKIGRDRSFWHMYNDWND